MDDMKKAIYLEILNELKKPNKDVFICNELYSALMDIYGIVGNGDDDDDICLIEEFFSRILCSVRWLCLWNN